MMLRALCLALALLIAPLPLAAAETASSTLVREAGMENLFRDFGSALTPSLRESGVSDQRFLSAWETVASRAFDSPALPNQLQKALAEALSETEMAEVVAFMRTPLAKRLGQLERATHGMAADKQIDALAKGKVTYLTLSEPRRARFDRVLELSTAEMTIVMMRQALRGVAFGLRLSAGGDVTVSWQEVDSETQAKLTGMEDSISDGMRSALAYTFADLSDAELDAYIAYLDTPTTRKVYGVIAVAAGRILEQTMFGIGQDVATRLAAVAI